jgi:hemerythrin-like domain-containing protein
MARGHIFPNMLREKPHHGRRLVGSFIQSHLRGLKKFDFFHKVLTNFRYEGLASLGKNIKAAEEVLEFFREEIVEHLALEEEVIFPYLERHIPRLGLAIRHVRAEHKDFKKNLKQFEGLLSKIPRLKGYRPRAEVIGKIEWVGIHLLCYLKNHLKMENVSVYRAIGSELKEKEIKELARQIEKWEKRGRSK